MKPDSAIPILKSLRGQRYALLKDALRYRASGVKFNVLIRGLINEIRALNHALSSLAILEHQVSIWNALSFYADPESYYGIGIFPDPPCGEFIEDFSGTDLGSKPGKVAREALDRALEHLGERLS